MRLGRCVTTLKPVVVTTRRRQVDLFDLRVPLDRNLGTEALGVPCYSQDHPFTGGRVGNLKQAVGEVAHNSEGLPKPNTTKRRAT